MTFDVSVFYSPKFKFQVLGEAPFISFANKNFCLLHNNFENIHKTFASFKFCCEYFTTNNCINLLFGFSFRFANKIILQNKAFNFKDKKLKTIRHTVGMGCLVFFPAVVITKRFIRIEENLPAFIDSN